MKLQVQLLLDLGDEIVHRDEPLLFLLNRGHPTFCYHVEDAAPFPLVVAGQTTLSRGVTRRSS